MSLLAVIAKHGGCEYINLALAERFVPLEDGCIEVQFSRSVVTITDNNAANFKVVRVVPDLDPYASQAACEAAGLPTWSL